MKEGSDDYWSSTRKYETWKKSPMGSLPTVSAVSDICKKLLCDGSPLLSGQNMIVDGGMSNIYPDQLY